MSLVRFAWVFALVLASCTFSPPPCGGSGNLCCPSGARCGAGMSCSGVIIHTCEPCGALGNACCNTGTPCSSGLVCAGGLGFSASTCEPCGQMGQPCCGVGCAAGLACQAGTTGALRCALCGGSGQTCCPGSVCRDSMACNDTGTCGSCGATGEECCAGALCSSPAQCIRSSMRSGGTCTICGGAGEPCCDGTRCNGDALFCRGNSCQACGAIREACCAGDRCPTSGSCIAGICSDAPADAGFLSGACAPGACDFAGMVCVPFAASICSRPCTSDTECEPSGACANGVCALRCTPGASDCDAYGGVCLSPIQPYPLLSATSVAPAPSVCVPSCYPTSTALPVGYPACAPGSTCDPASGGCIVEAPRPVSIGAPCTGRGDCAGTCLQAATATGAATGFIGGYCVTLARNPGAFVAGAPLPASNCAPGGVAIPTQGTGVGDAVYCYAACMTDCDCRVGYQCDHDPLRLHGVPSPNGACLPFDCSAPGVSCPSGSSCRTTASSTYLRYPVCGLPVPAGIDAGVVPVGLNTGCDSPDASAPIMDGSIDAAAGG